MSEEKKRFYYNKKTGVIDVTPFYDEQEEKKQPFIELSFEEWEKNLSICKYGFKKAYINNEIVEVEDKELQASEGYKSLQKEIEISNLKNYLSETDYIVTKLNELRLDDEAEYEKACAKYANVLDKRKQSRARINELSV